MINDRINIENNISQINTINNNIKKINENNNNVEIKFLPYEENKIDEFLGKIKLFWKIIIFARYNFFKDSVILNLNDKYDFIPQEFIKRNYKIKDSKLIYRATRDGDSIDNFFNKCNGIKNIILILK